jgi:hypothetical protein
MPTATASQFTAFKKALASLLPIGSIINPKKRGQYFTRLTASSDPNEFLPSSVKVPEIETSPQPPSGPILVGVGSGANTLSYSEDDGLTWVGIGNTVFSYEALCAVWNGTIWVAVGTDLNNTTIAYSSNGKLWTKVPPIVNASQQVISCLNSVVWVSSQSKFVAVGEGSTVTSTNGINWSYIGYSTLTPLILATNGSTIVGIPDQTTLKVLTYSINAGTTWVTVKDVDGSTQLSPQSGGEFSDILWDGTNYIAIVCHTIDRNADGTIYYNTSHEPGWSLVSGGVGGSPDGNTNIAYDALSDLYVLRNMSNIDPRTEFSKDGVTWTRTTNPSILNTASNSTIHGSIIITKQYVIIFLSNGKYLYSSNARTWDGSSAPTFTWTESTSTPQILGAFSN